VLERSIAERGRPTAQRPHGSRGSPGSSKKGKTGPSSKDFKPPKNLFKAVRQGRGGNCPLGLREGGGCAKWASGELARPVVECAPLVTIPEKGSQTEERGLKIHSSKRKKKKNGMAGKVQRGMP